MSQVGIAQRGKRFEAACWAGAGDSQVGEGSERAHSQEKQGLARSEQPNIIK